jgi:hypothetical protein
MLGIYILAAIVGGGLLLFSVLSGAIHDVAGVDSSVLHGDVSGANGDVSGFDAHAGGADVHGMPASWCLVSFGRATLPSS